MRLKNHAILDKKGKYYCTTKTEALMLNRREGRNSPVAHSSLVVLPCSSLVATVDMAQKKVFTGSEAKGGRPHHGIARQYVTLLLKWT